MARLSERPFARRYSIPILTHLHNRARALGQGKKRKHLHPHLSRRHPAAVHRALFSKTFRHSTSLTCIHSPATTSPHNDSSVKGLFDSILFDLEDAAAQLHMCTGNADRHNEDRHRASLHVACLLPRSSSHSVRRHEGWDDVGSPVHLGM